MNEVRLAATPPNVKLCRTEEIAEGRARNFVVQTRSGRFHGFVVRRHGMMYGYVDRCPHAGVPLARVLDDYLTPDGSLIACNWHGALFTLDEGLCVGGPCLGQRLTAWPVCVEEGWIKTGNVPAVSGSEE
ncbi:2Fe-2S ferredoxin [Sphingomonas panacis]|uniref:2Fe-2S ferredoxin n=1 Tax=Sphingomonas panacis TaxID=1560345 RepID=A0A1B3Z6Z8_9SPHN|nr:Rieske (2Fe-2S) protein [Sphingomonas panacis]AOH83185.1 2Fe-2S ferredoxin [Sphingomonas panacis]